MEDGRGQEITAVCTILRKTSQTQRVISIGRGIDSGNQLTSFSLESIRLMDYSD